MHLIPENLKMYQYFIFFSMYCIICFHSVNSNVLVEIHLKSQSFDMAKHNNERTHTMNIWLLSESEMLMRFLCALNFRLDSDNMYKIQKLYLHDRISLGNVSNEHWKGKIVLRVFHYVFWWAHDSWQYYNIMCTLLHLRNRFFSNPCAH